MFKQFTIDCKSLAFTACRCASKKCVDKALEFLEAILVSPSSLKKGTCSKWFGLEFFKHIRSRDEKLNNKCAILAINSKSVMFDNVIVDGDWIQTKKDANNRSLSIYAIDMRDSRAHGFLSAVPIKKVVDTALLVDILQRARRMGDKRRIIISTKGAMRNQSSDDAMDVCLPVRNQIFMSCDSCGETSAILRECPMDAKKIEFMCSEFLDSIIGEHEFPETLSLGYVERASMALCEFDSLCNVSRHWASEYRRIGDKRNMCRVVVLHVKYLWDLVDRLSAAMNINRPAVRRQRTPLYKTANDREDGSPSIVIEEHALSKFTVGRTLWFFETMFEMFDLKALANQLRRAIAEGLYQMLCLLCWMGETDKVHDIRERIHRNLQNSGFMRIPESDLASKHSREYVFLDSAIMNMINADFDQDRGRTYARCPRCQDARFYKFSIFETIDPVFLDDIENRRAISLGGGTFVTFSFPVLTTESFHEAISKLNKKKVFPVFPWEWHVDNRMRSIRQELFETTRWRKYAIALVSTVLSVPRVNALLGPKNLTNLRCRISLEMLMKDRERLPSCMKYAIRDVKPDSRHFGHGERTFVTKILAELFFTEAQFINWMQSEGVEWLYTKEVASHVKGLWSRVLQGKDNSEFKISTREWCSSVMRQGMCPYYNESYNVDMAHEECAKHLQKVSGKPWRAWPPKHPALFIQKANRFTL